jgi:hypothetical protein
MAHPRFPARKPNVRLPLYSNSGRRSAEAITLQAVREERLGLGVGQLGPTSPVVRKQATERGRRGYCLRNATALATCLPRNYYHLARPGRLRALIGLPPGTDHLLHPLWLVGGFLSGLLCRKPVRSLAPNQRTLSTLPDRNKNATLRSNAGGVDADNDSGRWARCPQEQEVAGFPWHYHTKISGHPHSMDARDVGESSAALDNVTHPPRRTHYSTLPSVRPAKQTSVPRSVMI